MDPSTPKAIGTWLTAGKDIFLGLSAVSAAVFAYLGLHAWRKELKGRSEYELAKEVLKSVYKVRDAFRHVRNGFIFQYEYPEDMRDSHGNLKAEYHYEGNTYAYEKRWEKMDEAFKELEEHHLTAQVEWGSKFQDKIVKLRICRSELLVAIQQMLEKLKNPNSTEPMESQQNDVHTILYCDSKYDKFTPQIDAALNEFEKWLRPYVRK